MSYILDALRKSQQARQSGVSTGPRGAAHDFSITLPGAGWLLTMGLLLLLVLLFAALYFWRSTTEDIPVAAPVEEFPKPAKIITEPVAVEKAPAKLEKPELPRTDSASPPVRQRYADAGSGRIRYRRGAALRQHLGSRVRAAGFCSN